MSAVIARDGLRFRVGTWLYYAGAAAMLLALVLVWATENVSLFVWLLGGGFVGAAAGARLRGHRSGRVPDYVQDVQPSENVNSDD
jgi:hypothetical protein